MGAYLEALGVPAGINVMLANPTSGTDKIVLEIPTGTCLMQLGVWRVGKAPRLGGTERFSAHACECSVVWGSVGRWEVTLGWCFESMRWDEARAQAS